MSKTIVLSTFLWSYSLRQHKMVSGWVGLSVSLSVSLSLSLSLSHTHAHTHTHTHTHTQTYTARVLGIGYDAQWWALQWLALSTLLMVAERSKQLSHVGVVTQCRIFFFDTLSLSLFHSLDHFCVDPCLHSCAVPFLQTCGNWHWLRRAASLTCCGSSTSTRRTPTHKETSSAARLLISLCFS